MKTYKTLEGLQGLRGIAFIGIFISHTLWGRYSSLGAWGVSVFFIMSGFVMMYSYLARDKHPKGYIGFAWRKIRDLYPLHIATMLCLAAYILYFEGPDLLMLVKQMILHATLLQVWVTVQRELLNGPAWYLCACAFCYAFFPFLLKYAKRWKKTQSVYWTIAALIGIQLTVAFLGHFFENSNEAVLSAKWIIYFCPFSRLVDFIMGCCMGYLFLQREKPLKKCPAVYLMDFLVPLLILISLIGYDRKIIPEAIKYVVVFTPTTLALVWLAASETGLLSKFLSCKPLVKLGGGKPICFLDSYGGDKVHNSAL